jgi:uncharacterized RDD family membrane protein YckC
MTGNDHTITTETPEHTDAQPHLAGIGTRFLAYLIDKMIQIGIVLGLATIALLLLILTDKLSSVGEFLVQLRDSLGWWLVALAILGYEIITKGYFILFEYLWNGSTPGKRSQEIRVVRKNGRPISFVSAVIRNIVRAVDILAEIYPVGLVVMFIDSRNRRLGDLAAGTLVVREAELQPSLICTLLEESDTADAEIRHVATAMTTEDYDLVRKFLARRDSLDADYRRDLARQIVERVSRRSVSIGEQSSDPEAFLEKLETLCRRETKEK